MLGAWEITEHIALRACRVPCQEQENPLSGERSEPKSWGQINSRCERRSSLYTEEGGRERFLKTEGVRKFRAAEVPRLPAGTACRKPHRERRSSIERHHRSSDGHCGRTYADGPMVPTGDVDGTQGRANHVPRGVG